MNNYALCVERYNNRDYILPMPIERIDEILTHYSKEEVLSMMREADSILTETNPDNLKIKKRINNKYVEEKFTSIITDPLYLTYPLDNLPLDISKNDTLARVLSNHLIPFEKRTSTKETYTRLRNSLNTNKESFLREFYNLSYIDQRLIRSIISSIIDIKEYLIEEKNLSLQKTNEKAA